MKTTNRVFDAALGARLKAARVAGGYSQSELGEMIGVSFQQIQKYEKGSNALRLSTFMHLCEALDINACDMLQAL